MVFPSGQYSGVEVSECWDRHYINYIEESYQQAFWDYLGLSDLTRIGVQIKNQRIAINRLPKNYHFSVGIIKNDKRAIAERSVATEAK